MLKRNPVYEAIRKGKFFEISYGALYDANKKRVCLTNCINIIKATKGKNLILTSNVNSHIYHRAPSDICSLLVTLGLSRDKAYACVNTTPEQCIRSARNRKAFKGVVSTMTN
jgi:ribonuclease P/MRP protein subunit RPP1